MAQPFETPISSRGLEWALETARVYITLALKAIPAEMRAADPQFSARELFLLSEAVEYFINDVRDPDEGEFQRLKGRLEVMLGRVVEPETKAR